MRKGENIFKRKDGRWEARYIKGYELSGKAKYGFCYGKTYKQAKEKVTLCKAQLLNGFAAPAAGKNRHFAYYCDEWLRSRKQIVRASTLVKYDTVVAKHIKPKLGGLLPLALTTAVIDDFSNKLLFEDGLSPKSVRDILVVLNGIMKHITTYFPSLKAVEINYPKESRREMRVLSKDEQSRLAEYLIDNIDPCKFGVLLMLLTGVRIGELCALKWENINTEEGVIYVKATMQRLRNISDDSFGKTRVIIGEPKSGNSARAIPITEPFAELCRKMRTSNSGAYILTATTDYMEPRALQYRIGKYTKQCGLEGVHAHTLRHTFATRAVELGFEIKSLSEVLGHSSTTVTLERYVHSSMELKRTNMDKLKVIIPEYEFA